MRFIRSTWLLFQGCLLVHRCLGLIGRCSTSSCARLVEGMCAEKLAGREHPLDLVHRRARLARDRERRAQVGEDGADAVGTASTRAREAKSPPMRAVAFSCGSTKAKLVIRSTATNSCSLPWTVLTSALSLSGGMRATPCRAGDVDGAERVALELAPARPVTVHFGQPRQAVALAKQRCSVERVSCGVRGCRAYRPWSSDGGVRRRKATTASSSADSPSRPPPSAPSSDW